MTRRPLAYLRRSSANTANGAGRVSYAVQEAAVLELAQRHADTEPEKIVEWGKSGAAAVGAFGGTGRGGKRRAYALLREQVANGEISTIYAYSLSRLARSTRELLDLAEACAEAGTSIVLAKEGTLDFSTSSGRLYLTILSAVATFEAEVSRERAMDRVAHARENGRYLGEPPFGWQADDGRLVHADDRSGVDAVLAAFRQTGNYRQTALMLNEQGVPAHRGGRWVGTTVQAVVARELGTPRVPSRPGSRTHNAEPLARLLWCKDCDGMLTAVSRDFVTRKGTRGHYRAWRCFASPHGMREHPRPTSITDKRLMPALKAEAMRLRVPGDRLATTQANEAEVAMLDERRARLVDALEAGTLTRTEVEPRFAVIEAARTKIAGTEVLDEIAQAVDWSLPADKLTPVLTELWERVVVDLATGEIEATWRVPEWRAA